MISLSVVSIRVLCAFLVIEELIAVSPRGDVVGKLTVGYQGWFSCKGDTSPRNSWFHWATNEIPRAGLGHLNFELWPDVREYKNTYQTGFANLGNGQPAKLFSSYDDQTVETHLKWMQQNGIDAIELSRFGDGLRGDNGDTRERDHINGIANKVMRYAEKYNRKFYIMYGVDGWKGNFYKELKADWTNVVLRNFTTSRAYARQNGKVVVMLWGLFSPETTGNLNDALDLINFLKQTGAYVMGGVPRRWRDGTKYDVKQGYHEAFKAMNMISPWTVGGIGYKNGKITADGVEYSVIQSADFKYCKSNGLDYRPVVFPGSAWSNHHSESKRNENPRLHGDFMWEQFVNIRKLRIPNVFVAMFDEYDEGTAIAKAAENASMIPTDQYFLTLDADGVRVSSDFYLRLANDGARMIKRQIPLQESHPTKHIL